MKLSTKGELPGSPISKIEITKRDYWPWVPISLLQENFREEKYDLVEEMLFSPCSFSEHGRKDSSETMEMSDVFLASLEVY